MFEKKKKKNSGAKWKVTPLQNKEKICRVRENCIGESVATIEKQTIFIFRVNGGKRALFQIPVDPFEPLFIKTEQNESNYKQQHKKLRIK